MLSPNAYPSFDHPQRIAEIWVAAWNRRDPPPSTTLFEADRGAAPRPRTRTRCRGRRRTGPPAAVGGSP